MRLTVHSLVIGVLMCCSWLRAQPVEWPVSQAGNGHYYEVVVVSSGIDWPVADQAAQNAGGHLATISSAAENAFVFSLITMWWSGYGIGPWLGGLQPSGSPEPSGNWQWVTGEPFQYTNWAPGQPDNYTNCSPNEDRIHYFASSDQWNDEDQSSPWCFHIVPGYIVEYSTPPIPEYQINDVFSNLLVNGVTGTPYAPATVTIPISGPAMLQFSSLNTGQPWELGYGLAPLVPANSGGFTTFGGQILNLDLTDPTFGVLWNYFQSPGFVNVTIPFSVPNPASVSVQMLVVAPSLLDGVAISQPTRLIVQ
jgi:hypothetical protein